MNRYFATTLVAVAAAVATASGPAFADDLATFTGTPFTSTKSRAEVSAELRQYRQQGVNPWALNFDQLAGFRSSTSRAQVTADYIAHRDQVEAMTGEDSGSAYLAQRAPVAAPVFAGQPQRAE